MSPEQFFEFLVGELTINTEMQDYYKFLQQTSLWHFRRNYFLERLRYVKAHLIDSSEVDRYREEAFIWDCGCGYGTTCLFLAMNGIKTDGTTTERYFDMVQRRKDYWSQYGNPALFSCKYKNLFDEHPIAKGYDWIIVQDTLHHLEPINDALNIFHRGLRKNGKILVIEENGNNLLLRTRHFLRRGNKRITTIWDDKLQKQLLLGNENTRSLRSWQNLFVENGFSLKEESIEYLRYINPIYYRFLVPEEIIQRERKIQAEKDLRREYLFCGFNFVAEKAGQDEIDFPVRDGIRDPASRRSERGRSNSGRVAEQFAPLVLGDCGAASPEPGRPRQGQRKALERHSEAVGWFTPRHRNQTVGSPAETRSARGSCLVWQPCI
jgi:SAM-dependent methyltransferase